VVYRNHLCERLEEGRHLPLTLVSAPAGWGKTTLVGQWMDALEDPGAWVSLDETDNDPRVFLSYFIAAVRTAFPDACRETFALLKQGELPPLEVLGATLINELDSIQGHLVLALDDYHRIREPSIHQILTSLLVHPPNSLHLAIMSRRDPPIPVASLRGRNMMTEVRARDLHFSRAESITFLARAAGKSLDEHAVDILHSGTEGWPVALRLAALALRDREDVEGFIRGFGGGTAQIRQYLVEEILSQQPPPVAACLCETSILGRFCAPLVEAVCTPSTAGGEARVGGVDFIRLLRDTSLPCVALDDHGEWYRHHHLFQDLLRRRLEDTRETAEIVQLHRRATSWLEENGLLEEALEHALKAGDGAEAGRLVGRHGVELKNREQWHRLANLLGRLPAHILEADVQLLLLRAWFLDNRLRRSEAWDLLDRAENLLERSIPEPKDAARYRGEIHALRSCQRLEEARGAQAVEHAERALASLPPECISDRGYALVTLALGHQVSGRPDRAYQMIYEGMGQKSAASGPFRTRLMSALSWVQWLEGDFRAVKISAQEYVVQGRARDLRQSTNAGLAFLGVAHYQLNELREAEKVLAQLVSVPVLNATSQVFLQGGFALASTFQARGRPDRAREIADRIEQGVLRIRNPILLHHTRAFRADLALRQGRVAEAFRWAEEYDPPPFRLIYRFYAPEITLGKVLIAEGSEESRRRAEDYLARLEAFLSRTHNRLFTIPVLALRALILSRKGDEPGALELLGRAVALAQPGGAIRVFADLDPEVGELLNRLPLDDGGVRFAGRVMAAFRGEGTLPVAAAGTRNGTGPLTDREFEILELLARRLSNKEIARRIYVAPGTVKRHTENIYKKLGVHRRHDAVTKAVGLGILQEPR